MLRRSFVFGILCLFALAASSAITSAQGPSPLCIQYGDPQPASTGQHPESCGGTSQVQVTVGTSPSGPAFTVDGTQYTSAQSLTWNVGDTHTISVASPQTNSVTEYSFSSWSDGGAVSHTVTASTSTTSYTASFSTSYLLTIATSNTHGTVTPASGTYYTAGTTVSLKATPASNYSLEDWSGSSDIADEYEASTTIKMKSAESITANFVHNSGIQLFNNNPIEYVVTTAADDASGISGNCPAGGPTNGSGLNCSLRDAIAAAALGPAADITFSPSIFTAANPVAQNTITLQNGAIYIPAFTTINGLISASNPLQPSVVTVSGGGEFTIFWIGSNESTVELDDLIVADGYDSFGGAGIYNDGVLTMNNCMVTGNAAPGGQGGGIYNDLNGVLTLNDSTVAGNSSATGGGIANYGTLTISDSTISGNQATVIGGGVYLYGDANLNGSTVTANQALTGAIGGGIAIGGSYTLALGNTIVSGNIAPYSYADMEGSYSDNGGNQVGQSNIGLAPLGYYGGVTETQPPLPGSPAICAGLVSSIAAAVTTDQRGLPNLNTIYPGYSFSMPCVDAGAVQTNYSLSISGPTPIAPATSFLANTSFTASVGLNETSSAFSPAVQIPLSLTGAGSLTGASSTTVGGVATYPALQVSAPGNGDVLMASLTLNPLISPAPVLATSSTSFVVTSLSTTTLASAASVPFSGVAQSVSLSAAVSSSQTVNAGTVTFALKSGSTVIGTPVTSATVANGAASVSYVLPAASAPGAYTISATYNAGGPFTTSSDTAHLLTVAQATSATALTSSIGNANLNAAVVLTATVSGNASITPTGSVAFYDGSHLLGSGTVSNQGVATYSISSLAAGVHLITAVYAGDANFAGSTSAQYVQTVTAPDYTLSANPTSLTLNPGQTGQVTFTFAPVGGYSGTVNFACTGLPSLAVCSFSPSSLTANGSNASQTTMLTITTDGSGTGTVSSSRRPSSSGEALSARLLLIPALLLGILLAWQRKRLRCAGWLAMVLLTIVLGGFAGCGSSPPTTAAGSYTVVITAAAGSGSSTHTAAFTLVINQ